MTPNQIHYKLGVQWGEIWRNAELSIPQPLVLTILNDDRFQLWSASSRKGVHHYGKGGLITHTNEVIDLMFAAKKTLALKTPDYMIFLSALWHDYGKLWDYERDASIDKNIRVGDWYEPEYAEWRNAEHKYEIHHISRSAIEFTTVARRCMFDEFLIDEIIHAILSHHGQKAWGSPVEPRSELAWLLHTADHQSARLNDWSTINLFHK